MSTAQPRFFQRFVWWTIGLLLALACTLAAYIHIDARVKRSTEVRLQSMLLAEEMRQSSDELTRMARNFVATGSPEYQQRYQSVLDIREGRKPRSVKFLSRALARDTNGGAGATDMAIPLLEIMRRIGITQQEFDFLAHAKTSSDTLALTEFAAMGMVEKYSHSTEASSKARAMLYDTEYQSAKADITAAIDAFYLAVDERTNAELATADTQASIARAVLILLGLSLVVVLVRANRSLHRTLGAPIETIHSHMTLLGQGDFSQTIAIDSDDTHSVLARLAQTQENLRTIHQAERKAEEAREIAMQEAQTLMHAIEEHAIVSMTDAAGTITYANAMFSRISGYSHDELMGQNHRIVKSSMHDNAYWIKVWQTISNGYVWRDVICNRAKDGHLYWVDTIIAPFMGEHGVEKYISIRHDLTAIKQAQQALESERSRLANLIAGTRVGTWETNLQTGETIVNPRWAEMFGYTYDEVKANPSAIWSQNAHPDDLTLAHELLRQHCNAQIDTLDFENRMRHKNGQWVWQRTTGKLISRSADGRPEWLYGMNMDITAQKNAEMEFKATTRQLQDNAAFLARAGRVAGIGRWQLNLADWSIEWSEQTCHIMDMPPGHVPNFEEMIAFIAPESRDQMRSAFAVASETGKPWDVEIQLVTAMGRRVWVRSAAEAEYANGHRTRLVGIFQDISQRRRLEDDIRKKNALMRSVLDHIPVGVSVMDSKLNLVERNQLFRTLLDLPESLFASSTVSFESIIRFNAMRGEYGEGDPETIVKGIVAKARLGLPHQFQRSRGNGQTIEVRGAPMPDGGFVTTYADITELKKAMDAAQEAARSKGQFVANMSHEIRTPMNAILGLLRLLQHTELTAQQDDYVTKTEGAAKSLLGLLNDILDFSKMEAGKMELDPQPFRMDQVMRGLSVILSSNVGTKPIEVLFDLDPRIPRELIGDSLRLNQVLINLAGNAIKFTARGEVIVRIAVESLNAQATTLRFSVVDTGIGIPPDKLEHVFEDFSQAEGSTSRKYGGTGLGLSISRKLVALMGGNLQVRSVQGQGSTFTFAVPFTVLPVQPERNPALDTAMEGLQVLIVDDNPVARDLMAHMAQTWGWNVETAASGERAVELTRLRLAADRNASLDVVLLDWFMPGGMDGWETLHALRTLLQDRKLPLYIMVTAHGRDDLASRSAEEQALLNGFLVKPITSSMLFDTVANAKGGRPNVRMRNRAGDTTKARLQGLRILVAEDNLINQQVARELLSAEGAEVELAINGKVCVETLQRNDGQHGFDVVLMDLQMPEMDGFTATRTIRETLDLKDLPIIAMTANAMTSDREACIAAGMDDHVGKPFDLEHLVQVILTRTLRMQRSMGYTHNTGDSNRMPPPSESPGAPIQTETGTALIQSATAVNMQAALERLGGNRTLYRNILQSYLVDAADYPNQLDRLLGADDSVAAARLLHTVKGLSSTVGAVGVAMIAKSMEETLQGTHAFSALKLRKEFRTAMESVVQQLTAISNELAADADASVRPVEVPTANSEHALERLRRLDDLLQQSDMEALQVHAELMQMPSRELDMVSGLDEAIAALDFNLAHKRCAALIEAMQHKLAVT